MHYGHFEYLLLLFGLANEAATFQNMSNERIKEMIELDVVINMHDILISSENVADHIVLVK